MEIKKREKDRKSKRRKWSKNEFLKKTKKEKEREKWHRKKKRNRDNRKKHERQTKSMKKTRRKKKEKEKETKNRKWDLKSGQNGRYKNGEKKVGFLFSKKQTNERNEKERKVLWKEKKKWWTRKRTSNKEDRTETKMFFSQKKEDQNKGIKTRSRKNYEKTHTWRKTILKRRCSQKACKQQKRRTNEREKTEKQQRTKKETRDKQKEWQVFTKEFKKYMTEKEVWKGRFQRRTEKQYEIEEEELQQRESFEKGGRKQLEKKRDRWNKTKGGKNKCKRVQRTQ